eukprot:5927578-Lingulodinium_polyedra.AAC.1
MELPKCSADSEDECSEVRGSAFGVFPGKVTRELVKTIETLAATEVAEQGGPSIAEFFTLPRVSVKATATASPMPGPLTS